MACVITVDGKSYDETGFKQMLSSGFLVNEINAGVLKDSKSEIYKQYVNGDSTKETARGEGEQALQEGITSEGEGTKIDQAAPVAEAGNQIPGFEQLTDNQKAEFDLALASINEGLESPISAREAFNKLVAYLGPENIPFITNMKSSLSVSLDESYAKNILKGLERDGKTQIKGKFARTPLGRTLLGLAASMRSLGVSMVVLSDEDFNNFLENAYGLYDKDRNAIYAWGAKTMVLRASNSSQVALHEFTHPILEIIEQLDDNLYNSLTTELDTLIHPSGKTYLEWAITEYAGASPKTIINEALTELISNEADNRIKLSSPASIAANRIWNAIMSFFGIKGAKINIKIDDTLTVDKLSKAIALAVVSSRALKIQELAGVEQTTAEGIASSKGANLVSEAGLDKYMTEDGKGNYVFYHVSGLDLTKKGIDPNKLGSNARTGRDEVMAKHPVSMYYTEPDMEEVSGSYKHVVLIPKNKVYPIDSDPLNLRPLAEKEFRKVFPNISFDNNRASSWIAKVAAEKGYDIVVANWSPRKNFKALRAESAIKHKPDLYRKPKPGSLNAVTFNEKYEFESNRNRKGFSSSKSKNPVAFENAKKFANESSFKNKIEFKKAIQDKLLSYVVDLKSKYGKNFNPSEMTPEVENYMKDSLVHESLLAISAHPEAIGWYEEKTQLALETLSLLHPELKTDKSAKGAFIFILAVTSNGNKVDANFGMAEREYSKFKKTGRFDDTAEFGIQQNAIKNSLTLFNKLLDKGLSVDQITDFFLSKYKASNFKFKTEDGKLKNLVTGELASEDVYGAAILGSKIGNGFYMNMWGRFEQLTMDRWFMRTWGRLTGTLLKIDKEAIYEAENRLKKVVSSISKSKINDSILSKLIPNYSEMSPSDLSKAINKLSMDKGYRATLSSKKDLNELRLSSNGLFNKMNGEVEAPSNGSQRKFIRGVFNEVQKALKSEHNIDITMADLQAVLWYPEKILYESFKEGKTFEASKEGYSEDEAPDYFNAAKKIVKEKGIKDEQIQKIVSEYRDNNRGSDRSGTRGTSESNSESGKIALSEVKKALGAVDKKGISSSRSTDVTSKFAESAKLFDQIQEADGSAKKRRLAEERRALIESSPEVKFIDDNIKKIYEQLENKGILTREGNCP